MKKKIFTLAIALYSSIATFSQNMQWEQLYGPWGGIPTVLAVHPDSENIVYAATYDGGVFKTVNGGMNWNEIGVKNGLPWLKIPQIIMDADSANILYVVTTRLYKSSDGGNSYTQISNFTVPNTSARFVTAAFCNSNKNIIYACIEVENSPFFPLSERIYRSTDGGSSWDSLYTAKVRSIAVNPFNPNNAFLATQGEGILRTDNGGQNWYSSDSGINDNNFLQIAFKPQDTTVLYAVSGDAPDMFSKMGKKIFRSNNNSQSWSEITNGMSALSVNCFNFSPANPDTMYAGMLDPYIYISTDGGDNWQPLGNTFAPKIFWLAPAPSGKIFASFSGGIVKYNGSNWTRVHTEFSAAPIKLVKVHPLNNTLFCGGDIGFDKSTDLGNSWTHISDTIAGAMDFFKLNPNIIYAGMTTGHILKSTDGGDSWNVKNGISNYNQGDSIILPIGAIAIHPTDPDIIYVGTSLMAFKYPGMGIYKSIDGGANFVPLINGLPDSLRIHGIVLNATNPDMICIATIDSGIFKSTDAGNSWVSKNNGIEKLYLWNLVVSPSAPNTLYTGNHFHFAGTNTTEQGTSTRLYRSLDFGETWDSTIAIASTKPSGGNWLLEENIEGITVHPLQPDEIYVGTHGVGVFRTTDGGNTWTRETEGVLLNPSTDHIYVLDLAMDDSGKVILSGSCGRGVFRAILDSTILTANETHYESHLSSLVQISPNPFNTQAILQSDNPLHNATFKVYNCFGQTVKEIKNISGQTVTLHRDNLPTGLYFLRLTEDSKVIATKKLLITD